MMDPVEEILRKRLQKEEEPPTPTPHCPEESELWGYLEGHLDQEAQEKVQDHLTHCPFCLDSLLLAQEVRPGIAFGPGGVPRGALLMKVVSIARKGTPSRAPFRRGFWLFLSLLAIGTSFFLPRYFFQCLILGLVFGLKWVFDTTTTRTLVILYEALKKKERQEELPERVKGRMRQE